MRDGAYYGYKIIQKNAAYIQELPIDYCRSHYEVNGKKIVEFNIRYFDDAFQDIVYREKVLKLFPPEFRKAYIDFKKNKLPKDNSQDEPG